MSLRTFFGHDLDFTKAATMFTEHHVLYILFALLAIFLSYSFANKIKRSPKEKRIKIYVAILLIILEVSYHVHNWTYPRISLPLHLCSFATFLNIFLLFTDSKKVFDYAFFFGILGGFMALVFPNSLGYTYYNFRYYHFILLHFTIISVPIYYYKAYDFRVTYNKLLKTYGIVLILAIFILIFNFIFNTNYWFISYVPRNVAGFFTSYPIYIISFFTAVFLSMNILYYISHVRFHEDIVEVNT